MKFKQLKFLKFKVFEEMSLKLKIIILSLFPIVIGMIVNSLLLSNTTSNNIFSLLKINTIIYLLLFIVTLRLVILFLKRIIYKINIISFAMKKVAEGELKLIPYFKEEEEIENLILNFNQMIRNLISKKKSLTERFKRYAQTDVVEAIVEDPHKIFLQPEKKIVTILFADIRGFTTFAEKTPPEEVMEILNKYLKIMIEIIIKYKGSLDKFIGDNVMVVFGSPKVYGDEAERAVKTAIEIQRKINELNKNRIEKKEKPLYVGIGISTGEVIIGNIGSDLRTEYTVIGDSVNVAARLTSISQRRQILISEDTYEKIKDKVEVIIWPSVRIKGREEFIRVYQVMGLYSKHYMYGLERRRYSRVQTLLPVMFRKKGEGEYKKGIANISGGGVLIWTNIFIDGEIEVKFTLPQEKVKHLICEVVKVQELNSPKEKYKIQIRAKFKDIKEVDRNDIIYFVYSALEEEKKIKKDGRIKLKIPI